MKVLNLYAGIGGNRKLWKAVDVTAIEWDKKIADVYQEFFPEDKVIVADAHEYLLEHYDEFDFIWSSPPCPSHSDLRRCAVHRGQNRAIYPDMKLYEEIILLQYFAPKTCKYVVENVRGYYEPLIKPQETNRHYFWANFIIPKMKSFSDRIHNDIVGMGECYGSSISDTEIEDKRKVLRNMVEPELGLHIFECAMKIKQTTLFGNDDK